jgi:hypothetical protein
MKHTTLLSWVLAIAGMLLSREGVATIVIDDFTNGAVNLDASQGMPPLSDTDSSLVGTIGGQRRTTITRDAASQFGMSVHADLNPPTGAMAFTADSGAYGTYELYYDGGTGNIGNIDLTAGGAFAFEITFLIADQAGQVRINVSDGATTASSATSIASSGSQILVMPFTAFTNQSALLSADRINVIISGSSAVSGDYSIDLIQIVPEPSSLILALIALLSISRKLSRESREKFCN